ITLDENITADDIINAAEAGQQIPVTGKASGDFQTGDIVTLTVNGKTFTGPVDVNGNFSINVPGADLVADGDNVIDASLAATDAAGNSITVTDTEGYSVDTEMTNTAITLDENITADDIINAAEAGQQIPVTGKASGDFQTGDIVTLTVNGKTFTGPVDVNGNFSINVPGADLVADSDKVIDASLAATDAAGNSITVTDTEGYSVDTVMKDTAITLDANITADDSISLAEGNQTIAITGQVTGDFQLDDLVTLIINNNTYTGKVAANGTFSIDVVGSDLVNDTDSTIFASLAATDAAGNSVTVTDTEGYTVPPVAVVDTGSVTEAYGQPVNAPSASINGDVLVNDRTLGVSEPVIGVQAGSASGDVSGNIGSAIQGDFGSLVLNANGSYEYVLDNQNSSVQGLNDGQTLTDTFSYTITDGKGNSSTTQINITINGITDPELQAVDDSASTLVGQPVYVNILGNDINPADSNTGDQDPEMTVSNVNVVSGNGQAYFINGELVYVPGPSEETAVIEYTVTNLQGQTDTATVTVDVTQRVVDSGTLYGDAGNDQISTTSGGDADSTSFTLQLGAYQGYRTDENGNRVFINEGSRIETLVLAEEEQIIDSKGGNDYVKGSLGADTIFLGDGYKGNEANTIAFLDEMAKKDEAELQSYHTGGVSSAVVDIADGGAGDDAIFGGNQTPDDPNNLIDDLERPIAHYDFIYGNDGDDMLDGGLGHDVLKGGTGNDILIGGVGNDDLTGGSGNDILIGGDGADTFRFFEEDAIAEAGNSQQDSGIVDTIMDFDVNQDKLDLSDLLDTQGTDVSNSIEQYLNVIEEDGHVVIEVDKDGSGQFNGDSDMKISLENVDYDTHGSSLLTDLMDNNQLIVDIN
ncbi:Ig-like domain-containing protein, partial [Motilimonas pumila]